MATVGEIAAVVVIFVSEFVAQERSQRRADYERVRDQILGLLPIRRRVGRIAR